MQLGTEYLPWPFLIKKEEIMEKPKTKHNWVDISSEKYRVYTFLLPTPTFVDYGGNDKGLETEHKEKIYDPIWLAVSKSGGHRIVDKYGNGYYIAPKWIKIFWEVKKGKPSFVL